MSPRVQVSGQSQVAAQRGLGVAPNAEEVDLAADLLAPLAVVVGGQWK